MCRRDEICFILQFCTYNQSYLIYKYGKECTVYCILYCYCPGSNLNIDRYMYVWLINLCSIPLELAHITSSYNHVLITKVIRVSKNQQGPNTLIVICLSNHFPITNNRMKANVVTFNTQRHLSFSINHHWEYYLYWNFDKLYQHESTNKTSKRIHLFLPVRTSSITFIMDVCHFICVWRKNLKILSYLFAPHKAKCFCLWSILMRMSLLWFLTPGWMVIAVLSGHLIRAHHGWWMQFAKKSIQVLTGNHSRSGNCTEVVIFLHLYLITVTSAQRPPVRCGQLYPSFTHLAVSFETQPMAIQTVVFASGQPPHNC